MGKLRTFGHVYIIWRVHPEQNGHYTAPRKKIQVGFPRIQKGRQKPDLDPTSQEGTGNHRIVQTRGVQDELPSGTAV